MKKSPSWRVNPLENAEKRTWISSFLTKGEMNVTKIIQYIFESIWIRILVINAISVFIGIQSNALITNITRAGGIDWSLMWGSSDFKAIAVAFVSVVSYQVVGSYLDSRKQRRVEAKIDQILANTTPMPSPSQISLATTNVAPVQSPKSPIRVSTVFQATFDQLADAEKATVRTMVSRLQKMGLSTFCPSHSFTK